MIRATTYVALMLLSACAAIEKGPAPSSVALPVQFAYAPPQASRDAFDSLLPKDDPAFTTLVATVDTDAPNLQAALARIQAARAALRAAGANRLPNIQGSGSAEIARSSENAIANLPPNVSFDSTNSQFMLGLSASWDADLFGRLKASQRAAAQRLDAATADARAVRLTLVADIARTVIDYRTAQEKLRIADEDLVDAKALVTLTSIRVRAGVAPGFDLVRAQSLEAAANAARAPAEAELAAALGRLVTLTARDGVKIAAALAKPAIAAASTSAPIVALPSAMLRQRPDVVAAEHRLRAANEEIAAAAAARFPQFNITSALGLAALSFGDFLSADSLTASGRASIVGPLLDFGRVAAQIDARQADASQAFALYRSSVFVAIGEAETALGTLQATGSRLAALEAQLIIERDSVSLARQRYRMGLSDFLSVIDSQRQLNNTRQLLAEAHGNAKRAATEVYRSFGGT